MPHEWIEWHGHNNFYRAVANSTAAWLYGCSSVNCSLFGIGERTGNTPLVTRAGIYADGLLKNKEIYNIFDTDKLLKRLVRVAVSNTSGLAGIAHWISSNPRYAKLKGIDKNDYRPLFRRAKITDRP